MKNLQVVSAIIMIIGMIRVALGQYDWLEGIVLVATIIAIIGTWKNRDYV